MYYENISAYHQSGEDSLEEIKVWTEAVIRGKADEATVWKQTKF